jgi:hypothetical protein
MALRRFSTARRETRLNDTRRRATHWAHGISMGALRGAVDLAGVRGPQVTAAHLALLWGGHAALYDAMTPDA